jgi:serine/threonine protein kinase
MNVSKIAKNGLLYTQTGTPYYASPEVWKDKPYDSKSDIWSLGCVIYEMTTLKPPFRAEDMDGLYKKVIKGSYSKIGDNYSKQLSGAIKMMLQVNPANRPDADQLLSNIAWKADELSIEIKDAAERKEELLKTIRANKNLHYLTERLPKSNYENGYEAEQRLPKNPSSKPRQNAISSSLRGGLNLPLLDRVVIKSNNSKLPVIEREREREERKPYLIDHRSLEGMLKIEGRSQRSMDNEYD